MLIAGRKELLAKIAYYSFYLAVILEVLIVIVDKSAYTNPILGQLFRITFGLFFITVCFTKYTWKEYLVIIFCLGIAVLSYLFTGRNDLIRIVIFLAACKSIDIKQCLRLVFWMTLAGCLLLVLLSLLGIFGTVSIVQDYGRGKIETRYVLGLGHPNALQCMVFAITSLGIYLYYERWKWYYYVGVILINTIFFLLTDSKAAFGASILMVILFIVIELLKGKTGKTLLAAGAVGMTAMSIGISIFAAKDAMCLWDYYFGAPETQKVRFYVFLNKLLTGRIDSLIETKRHEGIMATWSLFSSPANNYYFDMGWVRIFYWYGVLPGILIVVVLFLLLIYFYRKQMLPELVFFAVFALYTIVEAHMVSVYIGRNYLLFLAGMYWWRLLERGDEKA